MSEFYIVSNVVHRNGMTLYTDHEGKEQSLHESQGTLDGACAIYSLIMALKRRRHINNADVPIYKKLDKRSKKGRLLSELMERRGLVRQGCYFRELSRLMDNVYGDEIYTEFISFSKNNEAIEEIKKIITQEEGSIIIGIEYSSSKAHAMLVVGAEINQERIMKVLCLDPGSPESKVAPWNCYIDTTQRRGKNPFVCFDTNGTESENCRISDILIIE